MKLPSFIRSGDTIGITAPSFGCTTEPYKSRLEAAVREFRDRGFRVIVGETCHMDDGFGISTDPEKTAAELTDFYLRDDMDAVLSAGGGEMMCATLANLDLDRLAGAKPKWYMGFSDNTNFIFPMALRGVPGIYGLNAPGFGKVWEEPEEDAYALLTGQKTSFDGYDFVEIREDGDSRKTDPRMPYVPYVKSEKKRLRTFVPGRPGRKKAGFVSVEADGTISDSAKTVSAGAAKILRSARSDRKVELDGVMLGGCLDILELLCGTRFDTVKEYLRVHGPVIWAIEECDYNILSYRRALWHLLEAGWFDTAAGFLIGRPLAARGQEIFGVDEYRAVTDILAPLGVPVVMDADFGHICPQMPLVIGAKAHVTARGNHLSIQYTI
ncbi:MAG: LD-carboxypeptidase [Lachnospiraceae bacterium]|nr:LD-carboxypeptidase [Lachnospiraceae bacterium]